MTDPVRNAFLDMQNFYRSVVVSGRAVDYIDEQAPKAAAMPKLATEGWFEELEDYGDGRANIITQQLFNRPGQNGHLLR
ncbi:hypothetical protein KIN20_020593 [Parelaphostrongylus tenuis]|uniref:Uncharacterized protein n=1 Tax=Parelaphostrongylus tenuis TaxID=148309 RepID=A0AAD5N637_PARTN|nr:hypothetical protein KIN20_020593 [Parelaphostrongylus tenuis]